MVSELTVIIRDSERTLRMKHLIYDSYSIADNDPLITKCVNDAIAQFQGEPDSVKVKINIVIQ